MTYQVEYTMAAGGVRTLACHEGQEVAIQQIKDVLREGAAIHATMRDASGVSIWSGKHG
jgi:hypothetical protein